MTFKNDESHALTFVISLYIIAGKDMDMYNKFTNDILISKLHFSEYPSFFFYIVEIRNDQGTPGMTSCQSLRAVVRENKLSHADEREIICQYDWTTRMSN